MKTALLIHGYNGIPKIFEYLKIELETMGYEVVMPSLPTQREISFARWEAALGKLDLPAGLALLIAHSVGNEFMIRYCAKHNLRVEKYIGLAGFAMSFTHEGRNDLNAVIAGMQCNQAELDRFRELTNARYAIYSDNDHIVPFDVLQNFPVQIAAKPIMIPQVGHMGRKSGLTELPEVVEVVGND